VTALLDSKTAEHLVNGPRFWARTRKYKYELGPSPKVKIAGQILLCN